MASKVQEDGELNLPRLGRAWDKLPDAQKGHLDLPLTILYHTLPLMPSSASVAFTFVRKAEEQR